MSSNDPNQFPITAHQVLTTHTTLNWPHIALVVIAVAVIVALAVYLWRRRRKNAEI